MGHFRTLDEWAIAGLWTLTGIVDSDSDSDFDPSDFDTIYPFGLASNSDSDSANPFGFGFGFRFGFDSDESVRIRKRVRSFHCEWHHRQNNAGEPMTPIPKRRSLLAGARFRRTLFTIQSSVKEHTAGADCRAAPVDSYRDEINSSAR